MRMQPSSREKNHTGDGTGWNTSLRMVRSLSVLVQTTPDNVYSAVGSGSIAKHRNDPAGPPLAPVTAMIAGKNAHDIIDAPRGIGEQ
jgi:hypothetical protein